MAIALLVLLAISAAAALPGYREPRPLLSYCRATLITCFGVVLALGFFFLSSLMLPEWKGACRCGWVDGFQEGKLALTPVALLATAALYRLEVLHRGALPAMPGWASRLTVLGIFGGALLSTVCAVFLLACVHVRDLLLPAAFVVLLPVWYLIRAAQLAAAVALKDHLLGAMAALPLWIGAWWWSVRTYESLPDKAPDCFVVTAAGRGHRRLVGPFALVERRGQLREVNRQLLTFWRLEERWQQASPRSHRWFRAAYNRLGPAVARRIRSPWMADLVFLALLPLERLAAHSDPRKNR